ncbi:MAG: hypothetical protein ACTHNN_04390 [Xanthobacteraceae bacterium]
MVDYVLAAKFLRSAHEILENGGQRADGLRKAIDFLIEGVLDESRRTSTQRPSAKIIPYRRRS